MTNEEATNAIELASKVMALQRDPGWQAYLSITGEAALKAAETAVLTTNQDEFRKQNFMAVAHGHAKRWVQQVLADGQRAVNFKASALSRPTSTTARALDDRGNK